MMHQHFNAVLQMNFAEIEARLLAYYCLHDVQCTYETFNKLFGGRLKMIKLSNGVEISEDTVVAALKKSGISVEPKPARVLLYGTTKGTDNDIYVRAKQLGAGVEIDSVTKDGSWRKHICTFQTSGLRLHTAADGAGFPADGAGKIKLI